MSARQRIRWWLDDHQPAPTGERIDWFVAAVWLGAAVFCAAFYVLLIAAIRLVWLWVSA
jgi:hypothetical protein